MAARHEKLTKRVVSAAKPSASRYMIQDTEVKNFGLRVMPTGAKSYIVRFRIWKHRSARERLVTIRDADQFTPQAARAKAREFQVNGRQGIDLDEEFRKATAAPINRRSGAARRAKNVKVDVDRLEIHVRPVLGNNPLLHVTKADIAKLRDDITEGRTAVKKRTMLRGVCNARGGVGTVGRAVRTLSSVFAYAEDHELISRNPCRGVKVQPSRKCERYLSQEEAARLGKVLDAWMLKDKATTGIAVIRMLPLTGARCSEITDLKWVGSRFRAGVPAASYHQDRPLDPAALLGGARFPEPLASDKPNLGVPSETGQAPYQGIGKVWRETRKEAEMEDVRLHDLRHSFASFCTSAGLPLPVIGALLGQKDVSVTQRYAHFANDTARQAADEMASVVAVAIGMAAARPTRSEKDVVQEVTPEAMGYTIH
jgi:site-specific recombinase XerD